MREIILALLEKHRPDLPSEDREAMAVDLSSRLWGLKDLAAVYGVHYQTAWRWSQGRSGWVWSKKVNGKTVLTAEDGIAARRWPRGAKRRLSEKKAAEIRELAKVEPIARIAERYGISESLVSLIATGKRYV
jgi:hypothetical protein